MIFSLSLAFPSERLPFGVSLMQLAVVCLVLAILLRVSRQIAPCNQYKYRTLADSTPDSSRCLYPSIKECSRPSIGQDLLHFCLSGQPERRSKSRKWMCDTIQSRCRDTSIASK